MERIYAWDKQNGQPVYREPGKRHGDGQQDSDDSPIWLLAEETDLPANVAPEHLPEI
ncbi:hypothetical protein [Salicola sp. Rm-C-2C1-2]|uniref:hypothetical protein n=1 Tax=Salicola sp. Rm-C-2C1-2 TaxID=3141321 RepID=UPI0032E3BFA0